jgi:hypothetical protein
MKITQLICVISGAAIMTGVAVSASAQSIGISHKNAANGSVDPTGTGGDKNNRPITLTTLRTNADGRQSTSVSTVDFGVVKVASSVVGGGGASAEASGGWQDYLTLTTPDGASGFLNVNLQFDATITQPTSGINTINYLQRFYATAINGPIGGLITYFYDYTTQNMSGEVRSNYVWENNGNVSTITDFAFQPTIGKTASLRIPFVSGQTFGIDSSTTCSVRSIGGTLGCDAGNSSYWGGVTSVTNASGGVLSGWTLTSLSGVDYSASMAPGVAGVPEPTTWAMMIIGFGSAGSIVRRRRALEA